MEDERGMSKLVADLYNLEMVSQRTSENTSIILFDLEAIKNESNIEIKEIFLTNWIVVITMNFANLRRPRRYI